MNRRIATAALGVFTITGALTGCGSTRSAPHPLPTTSRQLAAMLPATADLPDGIRAGANPASGYTATAPPGPVHCEDLMTGGFVGSLARPARSASGLLGRRMAAPWGSWIAWDNIYLFQPGQAVQVLSKLRQVASGCATTSVGKDPTGRTMNARIRLVPLSGMGDEAVRGDIRVTEADSRGVVANDWIVIRSGDYVLTITEMGGPLSGNKYLSEAVQAFWRTFRKRY